MSETSTSHTQWIQHAVAAAKAGNPSIAKIQLQKAAEEAPGDPAVWLWMGWLADSPASAAQCLELARTDKRFEKIAVAGIEFAKALADFQPDQLAEPVEANGDAAETDVAEQDGMALDPVEAVEEVVAVVESLQHEDTTELIAVETAEPTETSGEELVESSPDPVSDCDETSTEPLAADDSRSVPSESISDESSEDHEDTTELIAVETAEPTETSGEELVESSPDPVSDCDETSTEPLAADDSRSVPSESISDESSEDNTDITEGLAEQPYESATSSTGNNVEAELMESANELWQIDDEMVVEAATISEEAGRETQNDQQLLQSSTDEATPTSVSDVSDHSPSIDEDETAPTSEPVSDIIADESEGDFAFATDDDDGFVTATHPHVEPASANRNSEHPQHDGDQWLGQESDETPRAPVWRKAQSDWFSVDGPSEPEPNQLAPPASSVNSTPISVLPVEQAHRPVTPGAEQTPLLSTPAENLATENSSVDSILEAKSKPVLPRVTASDVWQTAAIEKSAMIEAPVAHPPIHQPPVEQNPAPTNPEETPQSPPVPVMSDSSVFFAADPSIDQPLTGDSANAKSLDQKTVLVVDDSPTVRKLVAITLEKRGYKVVSAFDGVAAIKEIAAHNPSLILMDVNMPRLDGYQLCKLVKKHETTCDIPVLMLTGKDGMFDRLRGRLVGCAGSIAKPFSPEELLEIVEQNIAQEN